MPTEQIGVIILAVIKALGLSCPPGTPILMGDTNTAHMQNKHHQDYLLYIKNIREILKTPEYVRLNPKDNSIEYVKLDTHTNKYVKVAIRQSKNGMYFARSMYSLNTNRVQNFIAKGTLKKI